MKFNFDLARHVTSRHDSTFDASSPYILAVELVEQQGSTRTTRRARLARQTCRDVEMCRVET